MTLGRTHALALIGMRAAMVDVEADIAAGLPKFSLVGLPDRALTESADRVRSAIVNSGFSMPSQRVTVNLSPASLPKAGAGFDLAIALSALVAAGAIPHVSVARSAHIGELALDGRVRPTLGVLPAVVGAVRAGISTILVPFANADEARIVPGIEVVPIISLAHAASWHGATNSVPELEPLCAESRDPVNTEPGDLSEVIGQREAVQALTVAAAGGHHVLMIGPPGAGKTMLAQRLPGILPELSIDEALEVACARSVSARHSVTELSLNPPLEAPHHSASMTSLVGGGNGVIRPGSIARASHGVLFLDEAPEFNRNALDALREPLESGQIVIHRSNLTAVFPAKFQLVLAANPCPCGQYGLPGTRCDCQPFMRRRYLEKLSGPLRDRIDITLHVTRVSPAQAREGVEAAFDSATIKKRVVEARATARERWHAAGGWGKNADVPGSALRSRPWRLAREVTRDIDAALHAGNISMRGFDRTLRLAWTLADLDGNLTPTRDHVGRAYLLRKGATW